MSFALRCRCVAFALLFFTAFVFVIFYQPQLALAAAEAPVEQPDPRRTPCGNYSYILPEEFEARYHSIESTVFSNELVINDPFVSRDLTRATVICLQEKKTNLKGFILPKKKSILRRILGRMTSTLQMTAMEDINQNNQLFKFMILEEQPGGNREVRGKYMYVPVIEIASRNDTHHTMLFVSDGREPKGFFYMEDFKTQVNDIANSILESIKQDQ